MKQTLILIAFAAALTGCSTATQSSGPAVEMHLTGSNLDSNTLYFPGPIGAVLELTVNNPTAEPITLRSLDLQTVATTSFRLRSGQTPVNKTIPPNSTVTLKLSTWGNSRGGYLAGEEPITIRGTGYFKAPKGSFVRFFTDTMVPR
jgi:hypothetical protein